MHTFTDNAGRTWTVSISVYQVKRCRALVDTDLYSLVNHGFDGLAQLLGDPVRLVDLLYVLCQEEANTKGITDEDFGRAMAGDAIERAMDAFLAELTDFFPDPRVRAGIRKALTASRGISDRLMKHLDQQLDNLDLDSAANKLIASSGSSPASSESTPAPSPSANST